MSEQKKLVIVNSRGFDDERSSVAWSIANTASASNMEVTVFLVAAGVDWVRKGATDVAQLNPLDPILRDPEVHTEHLAVVIADAPALSRRTGARHSQMRRKGQSL